MEENKQQANNLNEAPTSATVKIKSAAGFEWLFTVRDESAKTLMFKMKAMEKNWLENGFTPLAQNAGKSFPPKVVEYVPNRTCPQDNARLVYATKKNGSKYVKCENNKWDKIQNRATGCPFVEWPKASPVQRIPERQVNDDAYQFGGREDY